MAAESPSAEKVLESHILSVCSAVGGIEETAGPNDIVLKRYVLGDECVECLRDLKRFLRYDESNQEKTVARMLGKWQHVQKDLVPILEQHSADQSVFFAAVELLVPLTWPLDSQYLKGSDLLSYQRVYKQAFIDTQALDRIFEGMLALLSVPHVRRPERTNAVIRLILYFFRNLLAIPDPSCGATATAESWMQSQMQERLLKKMEKLDILEFFLYVGSGIGERHVFSWNTIMAEIFFLIFCSCEPKALFGPISSRGNDVLQGLLDKENKNKIVAQKRHTRFAGYATNMILSLPKSGGKFNVHRYSNTISTLDDRKQKNRPKLRFDPNADVAGPQKRMHIPELDHAALLRKYAQSFLESCFDSLVASVQHDISAERSHIRQEDPIHVLYLIRFFLEFQRLCSATTAFSTISCILNVHSLLFIMKNIRISFDDKAHSRLYMGVDALKHLMLTLQVLRVNPEEELKDLSENMLDNLYYEKSHIDILVELIKGFKKESKRYLITLVETVHLVLKLLEAFAKANASLTVRQKRRRREQDEDQDLIARDVDADQGQDKPEFVERELKFSKVEEAFCSDLVLERYMRLLTFYRSLDNSVLHAITRMLYRIGVKCNYPAMFYKINYLMQMHTILHDKAMIPASRSRGSGGPARKAATGIQELVSLFCMLTFKFFETFDKYPLLLVEVFYPHSRRDTVRILTGRMAELTKAKSKLASSAKPREWDDDDEVEVRPGFSERMQIKLVASTLVAKELDDLLARLLAELAAISARRKAHAGELDDADDDGPVYVTEKISLTSNEMKIKEFILLLKLLGLEIQGQQGEEQFDGEAPQASPSVIVVPGSMTPVRLEEIIEWILEAKAEPVKHNNRPAHRFLRRKRKPRTSTGGRGSKPAGSKLAENAKSAAYIYDSDAMLEDDEDGSEYYRREAERRDRTKRLHEAMMHHQSAIAEKTARDRVPKDAGQIVDPSSAESSSSEDSDASLTFRQRRKGLRALAMNKDDSDDSSGSGDEPGAFRGDEDPDDEFARRLAALRAKTESQTHRAFFEQGDHESDSTQAGVESIQNDVGGAENRALETLEMSGEHQRAAPFASRMNRRRGGFFNGDSEGSDIEADDPSSEIPVTAEPIQESRRPGRRTTFFDSSDSEEDAGQSTITPTSTVATVQPSDHDALHAEIPDVGEPSPKRRCLDPDVSPTAEAALLGNVSYQADIEGSPESMESIGELQFDMDDE